MIQYFKILVANGFLTFILFLAISAHKLSVAVEKQSLSFGNQVAQEYGMGVLMFGGDLIIDSKNEAFVLSYMDYHPRTLDEVRPIVVNIVDRMWEHVNKEPIYLQYRFDRFKTHPKLEKPELTQEHIGFKISYWDESMDRRGPPYISLVKYVNQKFYFYYADPKTQELNEPIVETFQEAKSKLPIVFTKPPEGFLSKRNIAGIFCDRNGKFLFLLRQPNKSNGNTWGIPGGKVNKDESPKWGAIRELIEETGIELGENEVKEVGKVYVRDPNYGDFTYWMFYTKCASQNEVVINKEEHQEARWLTFKEALQLNEPLIPGEKECLEFFKERREEL